MRHETTTTVTSTEATMTLTDYASGLSRPGNLLPFARAGYPAGFVAGELSERMRRLVAGYAEIGGEVFVDSGAFSMDVADFAPVFEVYLELASGLSDEARGRLSVVAPDVVGDQAATIELLAKWAPVLQVLVDAGVRVLVPLQKGELSGPELFGAIDEALREMTWVPAFPCKKAATTAAEIVDFCDRTWAPDIHCLGLGGEKLQELAQAIHEVSPDTRVTGDSNKLRAMVGSRRPLHRDTTTRTTELLEGLEEVMGGADWDREGTEVNARRLLKDCLIQAKFTGAA